MMNRIALATLAAATALALSGCNGTDPYLKTDVWQPTGANAGNIAAMVANPHDLISGHGSSAENAGEPAMAVNHIWTDQPKNIDGNSGGGAAGAPAAASPAPAAPSGS